MYYFSRISKVRILILILISWIKKKRDRKALTLEGGAKIRSMGVLNKFFLGVHM